MIYIIKQEELYQNKFNSSLVSICNSKLDYYIYDQVLTDVRRSPFKVNSYLFTPNENQ